MSVKFRCMLADGYEAKYVTYPVAIEPKYDGVRMLCVPDSKGKYSYVTRTGKPLFSISDELDFAITRLGEALSGRHGMVIDGELISGAFNKTVGDVRRHEVNDELIYHVFDFAPLDGFPNGWVHDGKSVKSIDTIYAVRREALEYVFAAMPLRDNLILTPSSLVTSPQALMAAYDSFQAAGYEGAIVKALDGGYHPRRNRAWMKLKAHETEEVTITDMIEGEGKNAKMLGAFVCQRASGETVKVGTGFTDAQRIAYWDTEHTIIGRLIEVSFQHPTEAGSLRHPSFVRFRPDKE